MTVLSHCRVFACPPADPWRARGERSRPPRRRGLCRRPGTAPRGVTLLEVLFSMGIIAVGLLGVLIVLPFAGMRTARGNIADNADRMGRNAIREFDVRAMRQPNMWARNETQHAQHRYRTFPVPRPPANTPPALITSRSFCIDPLFVATQHEAAVAAGKPSDYVRTEFFPYYLMTNPRETRMHRINLRTAPGAVDDVVQQFVPGMLLAQAKQIFTSQDDLVFDVPADPTALPPDVNAAPRQNFSDNNTRRQAMGRYSWLATLTPKPDLLIGTATSNDNLTSLNSDLYLLSIVVFHNRDMSMTMDKTVWETEGPDNERLLDVVQLGFDGAGYGGGEVLLTTRSVPAPYRPPQDLAVRSGDWMMLSTKLLAPNNELVHYFRWYRVVAADDTITPVAGNLYQRNVTLHGPDWDLFVAAEAANVGGVTTQATVLSNVVAVYEKTVRLERSSLWTIQ